jgi:N-acetylglutamate synthase-like GNAT family acetyltransferase
VAAAVWIAARAQLSPFSTRAQVGQRGHPLDGSSAATAILNCRKFQLAFREPISNIRPMTPAKYRVRRATVDDLPALKALWQPMNFPADDLERRLTEFQVAEGPDGKVLGALALQIAARHGRVHSETFHDFGLAEELRPLLWERIESLARNHGLVRLWTQEQAPFWRRCGLSPANADTLQKLPAGWSGDSAEWLTVQLRDETALVSIDKEFELFMATEKQKTAEAFRRAKALKTAATVIAILLATFVLFAAVRLWMLQQSQQMLGR